MRAGAWGLKKRGGLKDTALAAKSLGGAIIVFALVSANTGSVWWQSAEDVLKPTAVVRESLELWLPYWPFDAIPAALCIIGFGVFLLTKARA